MTYHPSGRKERAASDRHSHFDRVTSLRAANWDFDDSEEALLATQINGEESI